MRLSVIIITRNEEDWIENCLKSVKDIAGEIVVVDEYSTDKTVQICKKYAASIYQKKWLGFSAQKNFALSKASGNWVFFIDADERISARLAVEIKTSLSREDKDASAYMVPRLNILLGQVVKHGGWWPDLVTRLAKRSEILGWEGELHEALKVKGLVGRLNGSLYHLSHRGISWMLTKSLEYIPIEAKLRFETGHPPIVWWRLLRVMLSEFWYRLIARSGWRDGTVGWIEAINQAFNMFLIYVYIWELQKGMSMEQIYKDKDKDLEKHGF